MRPAETFSLRPVFSSEFETPALSENIRLLSSVDTLPFLVGELRLSVEACSLEYSRAQSNKTFRRLFKCLTPLT